MIDAITVMLFYISIYVGFRAYPEVKRLFINWKDKK